MSDLGERVETQTHEIVKFHIRATRHFQPFRSEDFGTIDEAKQYAEWGFDDCWFASEEIWDSTGQMVMSHDDLFKWYCRPSESERAIEQEAGDATIIRADQQEG